MRKMMVIGLLLLVPLAERAGRFSLEVDSGDAYNIPTWLRIMQVNEDPIRVESARHEDKPLRAGRISFEVNGGDAYNIPTWLRIMQVNEDPISVKSARYEDKPFYEAPYYNWRIGYWSGNRGWEVELVHHKLYLTNPPDEVQHFEVSHGYNLITINRAWERDNWVGRVGLGVVLGHPESEIRGQKLDWANSYPDGFYVGGPTGQLSLSRRIFLGHYVFINLEGKMTASYAALPVANGTAYVPNLALHGLFGLGVMMGN